MSQDDITPTTESTTQPGPSDRVPLPANDPAAPEAQTAGAANDNEPTIGTGTSIALGCIAGTVLLIVIGLIYVAIVALL